MVGEKKQLAIQIPAFRYCLGSKKQKQKQKPHHPPDLILAEPRGKKQSLAVTQILALKGLLHCAKWFLLLFEQQEGSCSQRNLSYLKNSNSNIGISYILIQHGWPLVSPHPPNFPSSTYVCLSCSKLWMGHGHGLGTNNEGSRSPCSLASKRPWDIWLFTVREEGRCGARWTPGLGKLWCA